MEIEFVFHADEVFGMIAILGQEQK